MTLNGAKRAFCITKGENVKTCLVSFVFTSIGEYVLFCTDLEYSSHAEDESPDFGT